MHISLNSEVWIGFQFCIIFAVMWTTFSEKNQNFEMFVQKGFKQNSKTSGIPSVHHFIPVVVIVIEK